FEFWLGVKSWTFVTLNCGELPWTCWSARFVSPSCPNESLRIESIGEVRLLLLATVKSHARLRDLRSMPASLIVLKILPYRSFWLTSPLSNGRSSRRRANQSGAAIVCPLAFFRLRIATT